jgi:pyrroloquinoline quinone (PQQ) biosynthesis protein C
MAVSKGDAMQSPTVNERLDAVSRRWDLLQHPFYRRWVAGTLTSKELTDYAGQYAHVVASLPGWLHGAAAANPRYGDALNAHAAEEEEHVELWRRFAGALGIQIDSLTATKPNPATAELLETCDALADAGQGTAVAWALEAQSPAVSAEKLRGLEASYGISRFSGGEYFSLHERLDIAHAHELERVIAVQPPELAAQAPAAASKTLERLWNVLTSVMEDEPAECS